MIITPDSKNPPRRRQSFLALVLCLLTVALVFWPVLRADFVNWDDDQILLKNPLLATCSAAHLPQIFQSTISRTYTPLTVSSFLLERCLVGFRPFLYHLDNLLLHLGVCAALWVLLRQWGARLAATCGAALLFGLHPLHVESVAWITERKDVLYAVGYLTAIIFYHRALTTGRRADYGISLLLAFASVLAKPMALSLPWILFLDDYMSRRRWSWALVWNKLPFVLVILPVVWQTYRLHASLPGTVSFESLLLWLWTATFYLKKFFLPLGLSPIYEAPRPIALAQPEYALAVGIAALFLLILWVFRRNRWVVLAGLYYLGSAFFLFRYDLVGVSVVADRFMYLPSLGLCAMLAVLADQAFRRYARRRGQQALGALIILLILATLGRLTIQQCQLWQGPEALWAAVLQRYPDNSIAHNNLGERLAYQGRHAQAIERFSQAIRLNPRNKEAYYNKGVSLTLTGQYDGALLLFNEAIRLDPNYAKALNNRGFLLSRIQGQPKLARRDFDLALRIDPLLVEAYNNRGWVREQLGDPLAAVEDYTRALALRPDFVEALYNRGAVNGERLGHWTAAIADLSRAITLDPTYEEALLSRGYAYIHLRDLTAAQADFQQVLDSNPASFPSHLNIGSLLLEQGDLPSAAEHYDQALRLQPDNPLAQFLRAKTLRLSGQDTLASEAFSKLLAAFPDYGEAYYEQALLLEKMGDLTAARDRLQRARENGFAGETEVRRRLGLSN